jgi:hypothetical protein
VNNSQSQKGIWAARDRKARIAKNMPAVEAAIAAHSPERVAQDAANAQMRRIAAELAEVRVQIAYLQGQKDAVKATVTAGNAYINR